MSHPTHVTSLSLQAKLYVLILFKYIIPLTCLKSFALESNARFEGKQNDGIYRCNQQQENKSSGCDFLTIYPTELMIHLEWHACKDHPPDDSFKLKLTDETFTKHPAYNTSGIGMGSFRFSVQPSKIKVLFVVNP